MWVEAEEARPHVLLKNEVCAETICVVVLEVVLIHSVLGWGQGTALQRPVQSHRLWFAVSWVTLSLRNPL